MKHSKLLKYSFALLIFFLVFFSADEAKAEIVCRIPFRNGFIGEGRHPQIQFFAEQAAQNDCENRGNDGGLNNLCSIPPVCEGEPDPPDPGNDGAISKSFDASLQVSVIPDGSRRYNVKIINKSNQIFSFNTSNIASDAGDITPEEIVLHEPSNSNERYIGIKGIGKNNDIYYLMHLVPSGQDEWIVDSTLGSHLRCYNCGVRGLKTRLSFNQGIANFAFFVNNESPCRMSVSFNNGQWLNSDSRGFCQ